MLMQHVVAEPVTLEDAKLETAAWAKRTGLAITSEMIAQWQLHMFRNVDAIVTFEAVKRG